MAREDAQGSGGRSNLGRESCWSTFGNFRRHLAPDRHLAFKADWYPELDLALVATLSV